MKIHLVFAAMAVALFLFAINLPTSEILKFENVAQEAESRARRAFKEPRQDLPQFLRDLNYDQYRDIRYRREQSLWKDKGLPFQASFFHRGYLYTRPVQFLELTRDRIDAVDYSPALFDFGKNKVTVPDDLGFAGFRVFYPINKSGVLDEVISFLGESYFRALGKNQVWGLSARGIMLPAMPGRKEEFPAFTRFWLKRPGPADRSMRMFALLEGPSLTGAYEFELIPGEETRLRVRLRLFFRQRVNRLALAPLTSMYWYGENTSNTFGDFRPEVHDSDGLLIHGAGGEWIWRPLAWDTRVQSNTFSGENPEGFGLLQRDRNFAHYQDLEATYHLRPSAWVEVIGRHGQGEIELIQFLATDEYQDNVVASWIPHRSFAPGQTFDFEYVLHWFGESPDRPALGRCLSTRIDYQDAPYFRHCFLDFAGRELEGLRAEENVSIDLSTSANSALGEVKIQKNEFDKSWRASFLVSTKQRRTPVELRCRLKHNDKVLTETWTYTWIP